MNSEKKLIAQLRLGTRTSNSLKGTPPNQKNVDYSTSILQEAYALEGIKTQIHLIKNQEIWQLYVAHDDHKKIQEKVRQHPLESKNLINQYKTLTTKENKTKEDYLKIHAISYLLTTFYSKALIIELRRKIDSETLLKIMVRAKLKDAKWVSFQVEDYFKTTQVSISEKEKLAQNFQKPENADEKILKTFKQAEEITKKLPENQQKLVKILRQIITISEDYKTYVREGQITRLTDPPLKEIIKLTGSLDWSKSILKNLKFNSQLKQIYKETFKPILTQSLDKNLKLIETIIQETKEEINKKHDKNWYRECALSIFGLIDCTINYGLIANQVEQELEKTCKTQEELLQLLLKLDQGPNPPKTTNPPYKNYSKLKELQQKTHELGQKIETLI